MSPPTGSTSHLFFKNHLAKDLMHNNLKKKNIVEDGPAIKQSQTNQLKMLKEWEKYIPQMTAHLL